MLSSLDKQISDVTRQYGRELTEWVQDKQRIASALKVALAQPDPQPALDTARQAGAMDSVGFALSDKRAVYSGWTVPPGFDGTSRPWYKLAASAGGPAITPAYADASTGELYVSFVEPVFTQAGGALAGVVSADAKLTSVVRKVNAIHPTEKSFAVLVDGTNNTILAHARKELTLKPLSELAAGLDAALLARLVAGWRARRSDDRRRRADGVCRQSRGDAMDTADGGRPRPGYRVVDDDAAHDGRSLRCCACSLPAA